MAEISRKELVLALIGAGSRPRLAGIDLGAIDLHRLDFEGANMRGVRMAASNLQEAIMRSVKQHVAIASALLGQIHGLISMSQQSVRVAAIRWISS